MNTHCNIGLVERWDYTKYGSLLSNYALGKICKSVNFSVLNIIAPYEEEKFPAFLNTIYENDEVAYTDSFKSAVKYNDICDIFISGIENVCNNEKILETRYENFFRLDFADDNKKKIGIISSLKEDTSETNESFQELIMRYNAFAATDKNSADMLREHLEIRAEQIFEPILCMSKEQWLELAGKSNLEPEKKYLLTYISSPNKSKRSVIQFYRDKLEMNSVNIVDGIEKEYEKNKKTLDLKGTLPSILCEDFVNYFANADFVITDDYYGVCFALVMNKPFILLGTEERTVSLLTKVGMEERIVFDTDNFPVNNRLLQPVDFEMVNRIIAEESKITFEWLKNVVTLETDKLKSIKAKNTHKAVTSTLSKNLCVGCSACVNVCPKGALSLKPDEYGYYCTSINHDLCINCGLCSKICPVLSQPINKNAKVPDCYAVIAADEDIVMKSSSGGVFSLLANETFKRGGVVVGSAWKDDFTVEHIIIDKKEDMYKLRKSKYFQSYLGNIFTKVKQYLDKGIFVLFSGCGCQATGLRTYLKKDYDNLIIVDIFCHYSPSPMFFRKYIESSFNNLKSYEFRYKEGDNCWNCRTIKATEKSVEDSTDIVRKSSSEDEYQRAFHTEIMMSEHCANCKFQTRQRYGDISLGDFWRIKNYDETLYNGKGVSCVFVNNEKGRNFFESIPESAIKLKKKTPIEWIGSNGLIYKRRGKLKQKSYDFCNAIRFMPFEEATNYALKPDRGMNHYSHTGEPLQYDSKAVHFKFDEDIWEELVNEDAVYLMVKKENTDFKNVAVLPLGKVLDKNKTYCFEARFEFSSTSKWLNFYVKDSGTDYVHKICFHRNTNDSGKNWINIKRKFKVPTNIFDQFALSAAQFTGNNSFIAIDYIYITECDE